MKLASNTKDIGAMGVNSSGSGELGRWLTADRSVPFSIFECFDPVRNVSPIGSESLEMECR
jgi:hypothetical protein